MGIKDLLKRKTGQILERFIKKEEEKPPVAERGILVGRFRSNAKGFGFVTIEGEDEDYYIAKGNTSKAFDGDEVIIERVYGERGHNKEARITAIVTHAVTTVVGTFQKNRSSAFVIPDNSKYNQDIFISKERRSHAVDGQKVVCHIVRYGKDRYAAEGEIVEILGHKDDPGVDILSLVKDAGVPYEFPKDVLSEAIEVSAPVDKRDMTGRLDLRNTKTVTIDGEDTKDFDDAVSVERDGEDYILGVHIADVSHYVKEGSLLDKEAAKRTTSIYLADRVIPMLPHTLSNGICSLNEGEDRLALSCMMRYNADGRRLGGEVKESVIRVTHRMTYSDVNKMLEDRDPHLLEKYADMTEAFELMAKLSSKIRQCREKRGSIDFDFTESKIKMDSFGHPVAIEAYERGVSQLMIEDFMIAANETAAQIFFDKEVPFLYRTHEKPAPDKIIDLKRFISKFGYGLRQENGSVEPVELQHLVKKIKGTSEENLISTLVLRSMQRAEYRTEEIGHYGLAAEYYSHFTSPIRRYPDLLIHRIIKEDLHGKLNRRRKAHYTSILPQIAADCTSCEKRADDLERDVEKLKKVEYMADHIGEEYEGIITGVTNWGIYVTLPNTVEGLVPMATLNDDYYVFSEETYELVGRHFNRHYRLGTPLRICVESCDTNRRTMDFSVAGNKKGSGSHKSRRDASGPSVKQRKGSQERSGKRKMEKGSFYGSSGGKHRSKKAAGSRKYYGKRKRAADRQQ